MGSIYMIINTVNQKCYIGQTIHDAVKGRIDEHLNGKRDGSRLVKRAIAKYGKDAFAYEILHDGIIPELLDSYEIEAIAKYNTVAPSGYNLTFGGGGGSLSEESRRKISKAKKGKPLSEEHKRKISDANKGHPPYKGMLGKNHSYETRRKMSESQKGREFSVEHKRNLSESMKGRTSWNKGKTPSKATRKKLSEANKGENNPNYGKKPHNFGKKPSLETRQKMSESHKHPCYNDAHDLFLSLPSDMPLKEKRLRLYGAFPEVRRGTICAWVRERWT